MKIPPTVGAERVRILAVDDNPADLELISAQLERTGLPYEVIRAANREQFMRALHGRPDVVLTDFSMPGFSAMDVLDLTKAFDRAIPIIIVSGTIGEDVAVEAMRRGATDYLLKDRMGRLTAAVENVLERAHLERAKRVDRASAQQALQQSEERFRQVTENSRDVFWLTSPDKQQMLYVSPAYDSVWGRSHRELYNSPRSWLESIHPEDQSRIIHASHTKEAAGRYDEEYRIVRPDGATRWIHDRAFPVRNAAGEIYRVAGVAEDITERKLAETRIAEQAALIEQANDAIIVRDLNHFITFWSKGAERLYGWTAAEAIGRRESELVGQNFPSSADSRRHLMATGNWAGELEQVARDGRQLIVSARWSLLRDDNDQPKAVLAIQSDISERKKFESQFLRAQRLESLGTLASGIAHDLNNLLSPIVMGVGLLRLSSPAPSNLQLIDTIERSAERGTNLVRQILSFTRGIEGSRVTLNVRHLIDELGLITGNTFPKSISLTTDIPKDLPLIVGDPTQLGQVLLNLSVNARDAMPAGGRMTITARSCEIDEQYAGMHPGVAGGRYVVIDVADTGTGIPKEILGKIFDPFFTTKEQSKGTGLGLSTAFGIVRSHGGFITVYSESAKGSVFNVHLPAQTGVADMSSTTNAPVKLPRGDGEWILLVDDEASIRSITGQTLEAFGYRVLTAEDGADALSQFVANKDKIAVVLTDLMMPVMDGLALMAAIRRVSVDVPLIAASGLQANAESTKAANIDIQHFLTKPILVETLLKTVRTALREKRPRLTT